jgi:hypothetical protein
MDATPFRPPRIPSRTPAVAATDRGRRDRPPASSGAKLVVANPGQPRAPARRIICATGVQVHRRRRLPLRARIPIRA